MQQEPLIMSVQVADGSGLLGSDGGKATAAQLDPWSEFPQEWRQVLEAFEGTRDCGELLRAVTTKVFTEELEGAEVLPSRDRRYRALDLTKPDDCKVVILGQDPYPTPGDATGLAFSVETGQTLPRSLRNIYQELAADIGCRMPRSGDLTPWAKQGVLMLNTSLTVRARQPRSHYAHGWRPVTERLIRSVAMWRRGIVFILWGNEAGKYAEMLEEMGQVVLCSSHPSPMGGSCFKGFYGSRPFSRANAELVKGGYEPIDWKIE